MGSVIFICDNDYSSTVTSGVSSEAFFVLFWTAVSIFDFWASIGIFSAFSLIGVLILAQFLLPKKEKEEISEEK